MRDYTGEAVAEIWNDLNSRAGISLNDLDENVQADIAATMWRIIESAVSPGYKKNPHVDVLRRICGY